MLLILKPLEPQMEEQRARKLAEYLLPVLNLVILTFAIIYCILVIRKEPSASDVLRDTQGAARDVHIYKEKGSEEEIPIIAPSSSKEDEVEKEPSEPEEKDPEEEEVFSTELKALEMPPSTGSTGAERIQDELPTEEGLQAQGERAGPTPLSETEAGSPARDKEDAGMSPRHRIEGHVKRLEQNIKKEEDDITRIENDIKEMKKASLGKKLWDKYLSQSSINKLKEKVRLKKQNLESMKSKFSSLGRKLRAIPRKFHRIKLI
jgi:hypothetical protein